jgi:hypothetical protein
MSLSKKNKLARSTGALFSPELALSMLDRLNKSLGGYRRADFEKLLEVYSYWVKQGCETLGLPLPSDIAFRTAWTTPADALTGRIDIGAVILVPAETLMICHFLCRILTQACGVKNERPGIAIQANPEIVLAELRLNSNLRSYAAGYFSYLVTSDARILHKLDEPKGVRRSLWNQLLMSTEIFVTAYECARYLAHNNMTHDSNATRAGESDAIRTAALITAHIGASINLPFAHSGVAGVIMLMGLHLCRRAESIFDDGFDMNDNGDIDVDLADRLSMLGKIRYDPKNEAAVRIQRMMFKESLDGLWSIVLPDLKTLSIKGFRRSDNLQSRIQELPFWG